VAAADSEVVVDYKSPESALITHIRSTLIASSIQTLRERCLLERYLGCRPKHQHELLLAPQAPSWIPVEVAEIHYQSCERMELASDELNALWEAVIRNVTHTMLAQFVRSGRAIGGTPWHSLAQSERLFSRLKRGGTIRVTRRGPKEALIESSGCTLYRIRYFASAYTALLRAAALMFAKTAYARQLTAPDLEHRVVLAWV
jgi:hypothetical protein